MKIPYQRKPLRICFINPEDEELVAYCSLACTGVVEQVESLKQGRIPKTRSAIEIEFFAVHRKYRSLLFDEASDQHETLSSVIFSFCMEYAENIARNTVGAEVLVLYAVPAAVSFYERNGFVPFQSNMETDEDPFLEGCIPMHYVL